MPRVVHFEIHADDPERAIRFYHSVFGWNFTPFEAEAVSSMVDLLTVGSRRQAGFRD